MTPVITDDTHLIYVSKVAVQYVCSFRTRFSLLLKSVIIQKNILNVYILKKQPLVLMIHLLLLIGNQHPF